MQIIRIASLFSQCIIADLSDCMLFQEEHPVWGTSLGTFFALSHTVLSRLHSVDGFPLKSETEN